MISVDDDLIAATNHSGMVRPIRLGMAGSGIPPRPRTRDRVNSASEGETRDTEPVHGNGTEDHKSDDRLNGFFDHMDLV